MIYWILTGIIAGWLSGKIMKGKGHGLIWNLILGVIGGSFGGWMLSKLGFYSGAGLIPGIVTATIGAVTLIWIGRMIMGTPKR